MKRKILSHEDGSELSNILCNKLRYNFGNILDENVDLDHSDPSCLYNSIMNVCLCFCSDILLHIILETLNIHEVYSSILQEWRNLILNRFIKSLEDMLPAENSLLEEYRKHQDQDCEKNIPLIKH